MKNRVRILQPLAAMIVAGAASISTTAFAACTAGAFDTAFGAASTNGYVQSAPVFVNGEDGGIEGVVISSSDNGIVTNSLIGMDASSNAILGIAKFKRGGTLDTTFGGFGIASPGGLAPSSNGTNSALAQDSAGNVIEARADGAGITVTRFDASGNIDLSFGTSGSSSVAIPNLYGFTDATTLADGSVLVTAAGMNPSATNSWQPLVVKFTSSGALDGTFGSGGVSYFYPASVTNPASWGRGTGIAALPTGQIVVTGRIQTGPGHRVAFVAQLLANGSLDATFGTGGFTLVDLGATSPFTQGRKIVVQDDGKLVVIANSFDATGYNRMVLFRLLPGGAPDAGFGSAGIATLATPFGVFGFHLSLQNNGKIVVGSTIQNDAAGSSTTAAVVRFTSVGTLDTAFGVAGYATVLPTGWSVSSGSEVIYLSGGKILFRLMAGQGALDTEFLVRLDSGSGAGCH
jgi:uncharacterized delta-60 repeat protein